jgi:putative DNA primase/helicase
VATLDRALEQMLGAGMPLPPHGQLVTDGRIHRYGKKARAWYVLHEMPTRAGGRFIAGAFGLWGLIESTKIESDWAGVDPEEADRLRRSQQELEAREREKRATRARFAALRARSQWNGARAVLKPGEACPYLQRKGVEHDQGLRYFADGTLVVPMVHYDVTEDQEKDPKYTGPHRLVGLQKIAPDGTKRFNKGMWKEGAACRLGKKPKDGDVLLIAEGVATALSIRQALERAHPVFVAFDCYNLLPVGRILRTLYPKSPIVFCADDDSMSNPDNPGGTRARAAADAIGVAMVASPDFSMLEAAPEGNPCTDFNDLHLAAGLEQVRAQVGAALALTRAGSSTPTEAAAPKSGKGGGDDEPDWELHGTLLKRFTQVYPSDEAYDGFIERLVKVEHMRLMFGRKPVAMWLGSRKKRVVLKERVVFDPTQSVDPETHINLFRGLALEPSTAGHCDKLVELLHYLCGEDEAVFDWVLKWLAYPLQHVGAKMHTAIVMHGDPGAGKNLFFKAIGEIYGDHATVISSMQLESQFNDWLSAKLFLVANEVVARRELRHQVGNLLNLVTEPGVWINPKGIGIRWEANHANLVFFSNELEPLHVSPKDRRYMVIKTPGPRDKPYYDAIVAELRAGGAAALFQYLRELDLGDFGVETKPIDTQAKRDLVELGMPASQLYWRDLKEGALGLPYVPALVSDVYQGYAIWCRRNGEKMPERINKFVPSFMRLNGVRRVDARVADPDKTIGLASAPAEQQRKRRVFLMGEPERTEEDERLRRLRGLAEFRKALREFANEDGFGGSGAGSGSAGFWGRGGAA